MSTITPVLLLSPPIHCTLSTPPPHPWLCLQLPVTVYRNPSPPLVPTHLLYTQPPPIPPPPPPCLPELCPFLTLLLWLCIPATNHCHVYRNPSSPPPTHSAPFPASGCVFQLPITVMSTVTPVPPPPNPLCPFPCLWLCIPATNHCHVYRNPSPPPPNPLCPFPCLWLCIPATNHCHVYRNPSLPLVPTHLLYTQIPPTHPPTPHPPLSTCALPLLDIVALAVCFSCQSPSCDWKSSWESWSRRYLGQSGNISLKWPPLKWWVLVLVPGLFVLLLVCLK